MTILAVWKASLASILRRWVAMMVYAAIVAVAYTLVFSPIASAALGALIETSGHAAVTNFEIAAFAGSPAGIAFIVATVLLAIFRFITDMTGIQLIAASGRPGSKDSKGRPETVLGACIGTLRAAPRLITTAFVVVVISLAAMAPFAILLALIHRSLLSELDINYYLQVRPPEFLIAAGLSGLLALGLTMVAIMLAVRWAFVLSVCLFEGRTGLGALKRSAELSRGRRWRILVVAGGWLAATGIGSLAIIAGMAIAAAAIVKLFSSIDGLIASTAFLLAVAFLVSALLGFIIMSGLSVVLLKLYGETDAAPASALVSVEAPDLSSFRLHPAVWVAIAIAVSTAISVAIIENFDLDRTAAVTAHRGSSRKAPENSLAAIRAAIADKADYAEIDVQLLQDGTVILSHDTDLKRVTGRDLRLADIATYQDISGLDAGSWFSDEFAGEPIPTLDQVIAAAKGKIKLNIELKFHGNDDALPDRVVEILRANSFAGDVIITSLEAHGLRRIRKIAPEIPVGLIVTASFGDVRRLDLDILSMNQSLVADTEVRSNRNAGLQTHVWTVNARGEMLAMIDHGADNLITDEPAMLRELITELADLADGEYLLLVLGHRLQGKT